MIKFPSKLYGISDSVIGTMTLVYSHIPNGGIKLSELYWDVSKTVELSDFIDALDCMYSIYAINLIKEDFIIKLC